MILASGLVESPIIDANSPTILNSSRNELILLIGYHSNSRLLRNYLDRANPLAIRNGVDDTSLQKLSYLLPYHIKDERIKASLGLPHRLRVLFQQNSMHTHGRADANNIS